MTSDPAATDDRRQVTGTTTAGRLRRAWHHLVLAAGLVVIGASVAGFAGGWHWGLDLFAHFRLQYVIALTVAAAIALLGRRWKTLALWVVGLAVNGAVMLPLLVGAGGAAVSGERPLTLLHYNVKFTRTDGAALARWIDAQDADVVFLQELTPEVARQLADGLMRYRIIEVEPRRDTRGLAALVAVDSPISLVESRVSMPVPGSDRPMIELVVNWAGGEVALLSVHTSVPFFPQWQRREVDVVADWARGQVEAGRAVAVIGDLNATPWGVNFRRLLRQGELVNGQRGHGLGGSWPAAWPAPMRIPIDHCVHSPDLATTHRVLLEDAGSDHLPLRVELARKER